MKYHLLLFLHDVFLLADWLLTGDNNWLQSSIWFLSFQQTAAKAFRLFLRCQSSSFSFSFSNQQQLWSSWLFLFLFLLLLILLIHSEFTNNATGCCSVPATTTTASYLSNVLHRRDGRRAPHGTALHRTVRYIAVGRNRSDESFAAYSSAFSERCSLRCHQTRTAPHPNSLIFFNQAKTRINFSLISSQSSKLFKVILVLVSPFRISVTFIGLTLAGRLRDRRRPCY